MFYYIKFILQVFVTNFSVIYCLEIRKIEQQSLQLNVYNFYKFLKNNNKILFALLDMYIVEWNLA